MSFKETFYSALDLIMKRFDGKKSKCVDVTGIKWATFSGLCNRTSKSPGLDVVSAIIDNLTDEEFIEFVKKTRPHISWAVSKSGYREVRTYNIIGAKKISDLTPDRKLFTLRIPESYFPSDFGVLFTGKSMDSIIPDKAAAGVTREFDFRPGEIYLCELPVEGLTFKRVIYFPENKTFEFRAEPKEDKDMLQPHTYSVEEGEKYIVGKLTWVACRK